MSRITDEIIQRGIKIGKERALKMYAAAVRVYRQTGSVAEAAKASGLTEECVRSALQNLDCFRHKEPKQPPCMIRGGSFGLPTIAWFYV